MCECVRECVCVCVCERVCVCVCVSERVCVLKRINLMRITALSLIHKKIFGACTSFVGYFYVL